MNNDGVVDQLVEVSDGGEKYSRSCRDGHQAAISSRLKDGEQGVGIVPNRKEL